jgi:hypothetical protein
MLLTCTLVVMCGHTEMGDVTIQKSIYFWVFGKIQCKKLGKKVKRVRDLSDRGQIIPHFFWGSIPNGLLRVSFNVKWPLKPVETF